MAGSACFPDCDFVDNVNSALRADWPQKSPIARNFGVGGETHNTSYAKAQNVIPVERPRFAYWFVWSPNDGMTSAAIQADYNSYLDNFITLAHANGSVPVLFTSIPNHLITTSGDDATRLSVNSAVLAKASSNVVTVDMDALLTDGGSPARIQVAYSLDGTHPNAAGAALLEGALKTAIENYFSTH